jgi:ribonucrease Y
METVYYCISAAVVTYLFILLVLKIILPSRLAKESLQRKQVTIADAHRRAEVIKVEAVRRAENQSRDHFEELEEQVVIRKQDLVDAERELASQEDFVKLAEQRLERDFSELAQQQGKLDQLASKQQVLEVETQKDRVELVENFEQKALVSGADLKEQISADYVEKRILECQRVLKDVEEDLSTHSKRMAVRMLNRLQARYAPDFVWPKQVNTVEISSPNVLEFLNKNEQAILRQLSELSESVNVELVEPEKPGGATFVKLAGGFGLYKEAARQSLEQLIKQGPRAEARFAEMYANNVRELDRQALKLGQQAVRALKLRGVHPEIQKMVGFLNWRTSYRQNQYLHTVEVAQLAGLLAHEVGVDPDVARRCGLLHDIGKTLDYKIEGSHAVISGDYADRFGEARVVCDTCMSHHNDLVLETPMSYVLKTADTLSGARPGARVNLEEGYQIRLNAIDDAVRSFRGIGKVAIMNGGREVHVEVNHKKVSELELAGLVESIARKIEEDVAFPGQIKVLVSRKFEASSVA